MHIYIYIHIYMRVCIYIYIYIYSNMVLTQYDKSIRIHVSHMMIYNIYTYKEESEAVYLSGLHICIYKCIHICIYMYI
jgi:hypothetical protein